MQILKSKITLEVNSLLADSIQRSYLVNLLTNSKHFALITAPSGFGKTLLLAQFLKSEKAKFSYYNLMSDDANLYVFLNYYLHSISNNIVELEDEIKIVEKNKVVLSKYNKDNFQILENILSSVFDKINLKLNEKFFCVFENIDVIKNELWFKHFIKFAAKFNNDKLRFIFTGIHIAESIFIPALLNGQFSAIDRKDFDLFSEEINNFSLKLYKQSNSPEECEQVKTLIGGWISGLHLIFHSDFLKTHKNFANRKNILFEYFESEILGNITTEEKSLLLKSSFLSEINEEILLHLIKTPHGSETLRLLSKKIPFLVYNESKNYFHFSNLFKEFLNSYYLSNELPKNRKKFFDDCAKYYEQNNLLDVAFDFYKNSDNSKKLTELIINNALPIFRNGDFYIVNKWISYLDKKLLQNNEDLLYIQALLFKNYLDNREQSNELFNHFLKKARADKFNYYKAAAHIAENLIYLDKCTAAVSVLKKYIKNAPEKYKPVLLFRLHSVNYIQYNFDKCSEYLHEALDILTGTKNKDRDSISLRNNILNALGNIFLLKGDFYKSIHYYKQVIELIDNEYNKFETKLNLCEVNSKLGNFPESYNILNQLEQQKSLSQLAELKHKLKENLMLLKYEEGDIAGALDIIDELSISADKPEAAVMLLNLKIYFILNDEKKIRTILNKEKLFEDNEILNLEFLILKSLFQNKIQNLNKLFDKLKNFELILKEIELYSFVIFYLIRNKKNKAAEEYLEKFRNLNSKVKYENIVISFLKNQRNLYDSILTSEIDMKYFKETYFSIPAIDFDFYDIKVNYFGVPHIYFRGEKLADSLWKRNKFKEIFLYLYFNRKKRISKDELLEKFYPDADKNYGDNIFHQFLSNIRSVFANNSKAEFILYKNKIFEVNPEYILTSDAEILEKITNELSKGERKNYNYLSENYKETFMKNHYDEFAESQREYYANLISKHIV